MDEDIAVGRDRPRSAIQLSATSGRTADDLRIGKVLGDYGQRPVRTPAIRHHNRDRRSLTDGVQARRYRALFVEGRNNDGEVGSV